MKSMLKKILLLVAVGVVAFACKDVKPEPKPEPEPSVFKITINVADGEQYTSHIDSAVTFEFVGKLGCELFVVFGGEISQCIADSQTFFGFRQDIFTFGSVIDTRVVLFLWRQYVGDSLQDLSLKICHILLFLYIFLQ